MRDGGAPVLFHGATYDNSVGDGISVLEIVRERYERLPRFGQQFELPRIAASLEGLAAVAAKWTRTARLCGAVAVAREAPNACVLPAERAAWEARNAAVRAALGEEAFAMAWAAGRTMPLDDAMSFALGETRETSP
jgi:hypothetical protein